MKQTNERFSNNSKRMAAASFAVFLTVLALAAAVVPARAAPAFNNVQVFVETSSDLPYSYAFSAYNESGYLVGSYQTPFAAASFQLPSGNYLITVSAIYQVYSPCYLCLSPGSYSSGGASIASPYRYYQPSAEYGYQNLAVSGPDSITIKTQNVSSISTVPVTVKVNFANGTAAAGASVSASIVGQWYYWWGSDNKIVMWGQTDANGIASLVLPSAPAEITAWHWLPVNLPESQTTVQQIVAGEKINVTVYWQPTYVGFAASELLMPPDAEVTLTLHYQQPDYWVMPYAAQYAKSDLSGAPATLASQPGGVPNEVRSSQGQQGPSNQFFVPSQISNLPTPSVVTTTVSGGSLLSGGDSLLIAVGITAAVGLAAASLVIVAVRGRK